MLCREMKPCDGMVSSEAGLDPVVPRLSEGVTWMLKSLRKKKAAMFLGGVAVVLNLGNSALQGPPGNVWGHVWLSQWWRNATGIEWIEVRDGATHPVIHRMAPQQRLVLPRTSIEPRVKRPDLKPQATFHPIVWLLPGMIHSWRSGSSSGYH